MAHLIRTCELDIQQSKLLIVSKHQRLSHSSKILLWKLSTILKSMSLSQHFFSQQNTVRSIYYLFLQWHYVWQIGANIEFFCFHDAIEINIKVAAKAVSCLPEEFVKISWKRMKADYIRTSVFQEVILQHLCICLLRFQKQ